MATDQESNLNGGGGGQSWEGKGRSTTLQKVREIQRKLRTKLPPGRTREILHKEGLGGEEAREEGSWPGDGCRNPLRVRGQERGREEKKRSTKKKESRK